MTHPTGYMMKPDTTMSSKQKNNLQRKGTTVVMETFGKIKKKKEAIQEQLD